jgi:hypothetical protein
MFMHIAQTIATDNDYTQIRCSYDESPILGAKRISIAFGYVNSISLSIDEAKRLFLELEVALREAYDAEGANV